jgi:hypothetical protein
MSGHTREEGWSAEREKLRANISDYYKAKRIARMVQRELGVRDPRAVDYWSIKSFSLKEMSRLMRSATISIVSDRKYLGLERGVEDEYKPSSSEKYILDNIGIKYPSSVSRRILSVDETALIIGDFISKVEGAKLVMPKYYDQLVIMKGIGVSTGAVVLQGDRGPKKYSGGMKTLNARELKASWLWDDNLRAFRVAAVAISDKIKHRPVIGYVVRSSVTSDVQPAFNTDLTKAVSLCKRRVKAEVMKQMGV